MDVNDVNDRQHDRVLRLGERYTPPPFEEELYAYKILLAVASVLMLTMTTAAQQGALQSAAATLGVANIKSLEFVGTGQAFSVGQNYVASDPWPAVPLKNYTATINYDAGSMRIDLFARWVRLCREAAAPHSPATSDRLSW